MGKDTGAFNMLLLGENDLNILNNTTYKEKRQLQRETISVATEIVEEPIL